MFQLCRTQGISFYGYRRSVSRHEIELCTSYARKILKTSVLRTSLLSKSTMNNRLNIQDTLSIVVNIIDCGQDIVTVCVYKVSPYTFYSVI